MKTVERLKDEMRRDRVKVRISTLLRRARKQGLLDSEKDDLYREISRLRKLLVA